MAAHTPYQRLPSAEVDDAASSDQAHNHETISAPSAPVVEVVDTVPLHPLGENATQDQASESLPPSYTASSSAGSRPSSSNDTTTTAPPSYTPSSSITPNMEDAKLPTYEEYEKLHENEDEFDTNLPEPYIMPATDYTSPREGVPAVTVVEGYEFALGDDLTFCSTFFVSFFLNWLGFLLAYIFSRTIAGKCGSTSGFGLGLIKLAFYLRAAETQKGHAQEGEGHQQHGGSSGQGSYDSTDQSMAWLVWLLIMFGWFTFVRGITLYIKYKRQFAMLQGDASTV